jgi:hypothetical protein
MTPTPEMVQWLTDNRDDYEFYLVHAMLHDPLQRAALLGVPVTPEDFRREEYSVLVRAVTGAHRIMGVLGGSLPSPPTAEFLKTYIESAARVEGSDDEMVRSTMALAASLEDPSYTAQHYCINPYLSAWYGAARAKQAARELQKVPIPNVSEIIQKLETELAAVAQVSAPTDEREFDFDTPPVPPEPLLKLGDHTICTPGNIVNLQGPPKVAKSAVIGAILAATIAQPGNRGDTLGFSAESLAGRAVLHFDTEQSHHAHDALVRRAYLRANRRERVASLHSYCLTGMEPSMCWDTLMNKLREAAGRHGGVMIVIIDGIADFCVDPNDAVECFSLVRRLHRIASEYGCGVLTVLHENPGSGSGKARGHLGSQLERKAETSLRLKKDLKTGVSSMWAERARHCFIPQASGKRFHWCDQAKMHVSTDESGMSSLGSALDKNSRYEMEVSKAVKEGEELSYSELTARIVDGQGLAASTVKSRIPEYLRLNLLEKNDQGKYRLTREK